MSLTLAPRFDVLAASLPLFEETDATGENLAELANLVAEFRALVAAGIITATDRAELGRAGRELAELVADYFARIESGE